MLLFTTLFVIFFVIVLLCIGFGLSYYRTKQKQHIRMMLRNVHASAAEQRSAQFLKPDEDGNVLTKLLSRFRFMSRLDLILEQAGKNWTGVKFVSISYLTGTVG